VSSNPHVSGPPVVICVEKMPSPYLVIKVGLVIKMICKLLLIKVIVNRKYKDVRDGFLLQVTNHGMVV
jgi:hypothetical protein